MRTTTVTHFLDDDGVPVVSVPLTNSEKRVQLYQEDFNRLIEEGFDPRWRLSNGQVLERGRTRRPVKRMVAGIGKGQMVRLFDGDPCNLKRSNFIIGPDRRVEAILEHDYINPDYKRNSYEDNRH